MISSVNDLNSVLKSICYLRFTLDIHRCNWWHICRRISLPVILKYNEPISIDIQFSIWINVLFFPKSIQW